MLTKNHTEKRRIRRQFVHDLSQTSRVILHPIFIIINKLIVEEIYSCFVFFSSSLIIIIIISGKMTTNPKIVK